MSKPDTRKDHELMTALQNGDKSAFDVLVERHRKFVLNVIYRYLPDRDEAEDLAQEVFVRLYQKCNAFQPVAKFTTWLYALISNLCLNHVRDAKRRGAVPMSALGGESRPYDVADTTRLLASHRIESAEMQEIVRRMLEELPGPQRLAVVLYRFEELSYSDIAEAMQSTVPAVKSLLFRARATLAEKLAPYVQTR